MHHRKLNVIGISFSSMWSPSHNFHVNFLFTLNNEDSCRSWETFHGHEDGQAKEDFWWHFVSWFKMQILVFESASVRSFWRNQINTNLQLSFMLRILMNVFVLRAGKRIMWRLNSNILNGNYSEKIFCSDKNVEWLRWNCSS